MSTFIEALDAHLVNEYSASQQYIAIAVWYDDQTLPMLARHFYRQAVEERNHAMIIVQYLHGRRREGHHPGCAGAATGFPGRHRAGASRARPGAGGHGPDRGARPISPARRATWSASSSWPGSCGSSGRRWRAWPTCCGPSSGRRPTSCSPRHTCPRDGGRRRQERRAPGGGRGALSHRCSPGPWSPGDTGGPDGRPGVLRRDRRGGLHPAGPVAARGHVTPGLAAKRPGGCWRTPWRSTSCSGHDVHPVAWSRRTSRSCGGPCSRCPRLFGIAGVVLYRRAPP